MLLLDELIEAGDGFARTSARFEPGHPFVCGQGQLDAVALIELMAQTAAVLKGHEALRAGDSPRIGYLVGLKATEIVGRPRIGQALDIEARQSFALDAIAIVDATVRQGETVLATGALKVWETAAAAPARGGENTPTPTGEIASSDQAAAVATDNSPMRRAVSAAATAINRGIAGDSATGVFLFGIDFLGFNGHFPGDPVLPGVVLLDMAAMICEAAVGRQVVISGVKHAKFSGRVLPAQEIRAEVHTTPEVGGWQARARFTRDETAVANFGMSVVPVAEA